MIEIKRQSEEFVQPTAEEVRGWLGQSVGIFYKNMLLEEIEEIKENWVNGTYLGDTSEQTIQRNAEALGQAQQVAKMLLTLEEMTIDEEVTD